MNPEERPQRIARLATQAAQMVADQLENTPLVQIPADLLPDGPAALYLKLECCQRSGSFKARGATHFIERLVSDQMPAGVLTYSSGNHGRAVAEAAAQRGIPALVVAPDTIDAVKAQAVTDAGAELVRVGPTTDERKARAEQIVAERGWTMVPPFDHDWIMAGQGTLLLEVIAEIGDFDHLWVPVGGGGLSGGCAAVAAARIPDCQVHTVEPIGSASLAASLAAGRHLRLDQTSSEADGLLPMTVGDRNWQVLSSVAVTPEVISEAQLIESLKILHRVEIAAEPSGACAAAPILAADSQATLPEGIHVAVVSGGNVSAQRLAKLLA
ncbi:MAG: pyridoxal-phosphate dependent enzyme [Planctomycetota bacterium]|nr:pyridoxal-phosphate dependent enzyme [Planctomycetota bacterium]